MNEVETRTGLAPGGSVEVKEDALPVPPEPACTKNCPTLDGRPVAAIVGSDKLNPRKRVLAASTMIGIMSGGTTFLRVRRDEM